MAITTNPSEILGWGADANPTDRPAFPKERTPPRFINPHWDQPEQQAVNTTIFHSTERPGLTPVFGTKQPPRGLSGLIRRWAFRYSENDLRHWFLLLGADRVDVVEGIFSDLLRGHIPNIPAEMGWKAEWKYNRKAAVTKLAVGAVIVGAGIYFLSRRASE